MRVAFGTDEENELTRAILAWLHAHDHQTLEIGGDWTDVGRGVGEAVARGDAQCGIACCWTGTGASIAANKVSGVRAALCADAQTASGAREWNDANVLAVSLRATSIPVAQEILVAWFAGAPTTDETYRAMIEKCEGDR